MSTVELTNGTAAVLGCGELVTGVNRQQLETDADAALQSATKLGDTDSTVFSCVPEVRRLKVAGISGDTEGCTVTLGWSVTLSGVLRRWSAEAIRLLAGTEALDLPDVEELPNVCWVGPSTRGKAVLLLEHAWPEGGLTVKTKADGAAELHFTLRAHTEDGMLPCRMMLTENLQISG